MLTLKLQYFGHLMRRVDSLEKTLMLGGIGGRRRRGQQRMRWLDGTSLTRWTWVWVNSGSWWWTGGLACRDSWGRKESDMTERLHFHFHPLCTFLQHPLILVAFLHLFVRSYDQVSPVRQQTLSEEGPHLLLFTVVPPAPSTALHPHEEFNKHLLSKCYLFIRLSQLVTRLTRDSYSWRFQ